MNERKDNKTTLHFLRFALFTLFIGRAYEHLFMDPPFRAVIWNYKFSGWFVEGVLNWNWDYFLISLPSDRFIDYVVQGFGVFYFFCAFLVLFANKKMKWVKLVMYVSSVFLALLACMVMIDHHTIWLQLFESGIQIVAPLVFVQYLYKGRLSYSYVLWTKACISVTFIAHGLYAIGYYPVPIHFVKMWRNTIGLSHGQAMQVLWLIGMLDIVAALALFSGNMKLIKACLAYIVFWGLATALARIAGNFYSSFPMYSLKASWYLCSYRMVHGLLPLVLLLSIKYEFSIKSLRSLRLSVKL